MSVSRGGGDSCVQGFSRCRLRADGSPNFQGTVVHGLYEVTRGEARTFPGLVPMAYLKYACTGVFGCG